MQAAQNSAQVFLGANIYAFVGLIMLVGIVKKNAIMQIDFAVAMEREGKSPEQAIYEGWTPVFRDQLPLSGPMTELVSSSLLDRGHSTDYPRTALAQEYTSSV